MSIEDEISWSQLMEFLIQAAHQLQVSPIVKYTALSLFADRFCSALTRYIERGNHKGNWLTRSIRESNLQLFALVSLWISSKIHDSPPVSVKSFKLLGDKIIKEQHFTSRDFLEAVRCLQSIYNAFRNGFGRHFVVSIVVDEHMLQEIVFMEVLDFEIGTSNIAFIFLDELLIQFKGVAKVGELVSFEACMDLMDLLYQKEETSIFYRSPRSLAASVLVASYLITVPKQRLEFPVLAWVNFVTSCKEEDIVELVQDILKQVFEQG